MDYHALTVTQSLSSLSVNPMKGLTETEIRESERKYGINTLTKLKKKSIFSKIIEIIKEPMLLILTFSFLLAFGVALGKFFKTGEKDFAESIGVLIAIVLSTVITLVMEGSSERAFSALSKIYDRILVKVKRNGELVIVAQTEIRVGDIVYIEAGDKIVADGRLIEQNGLMVDESALTGESIPVKKKEDAIFSQGAPLAERKNMVYSGTFVSGGSGVVLVTAVGDKTEIGKVANYLKSEKEIVSPLNQKLQKLGKTITIIGLIVSSFVFLVSLIRLILVSEVTFFSVQELFISCVILIVAAVPEGLPTIVAVSLALNMIKLAKENALIKKMIATETAGAVSVICSDKTGTLTENKMKVLSVCQNDRMISPEKITNEYLLQNFVCNSTAELIIKNKKVEGVGNGTECALLKSIVKKLPNADYQNYRNSFSVIDRQAFSSEKKFMSTTIKTLSGNLTLIKGAPEKILKMCSLTEGQTHKILLDVSVYQKTLKRVICFAHKLDGEDFFEYDGYAVLADGIRKEVFKAVNECFRAGIKVKILTGDNMHTAVAVAKKLNILTDERQVINAVDVEKLSDENLKKILPRITVVARSTPAVKLRIVKALKEMGEVVAVTGDGINDAPAVKHADVGIVMGITGNEITKECADVILLDDSFATIVKAISFGRNVFKNLQRFILFQLSVNFSALLFISVCALLGATTPFNTLQLLWINIIMDGPPALTLGLERATSKLMDKSPVKRTDGIVSTKMLCRIAFNGIFVGTIMLLQYFFNILRLPQEELGAGIFTLFILFQLFNAFNSRELGKESLFSRFWKNKIMLITFLATFLIQVVIVQIIPQLFGVQKLCLSSWLKIIVLSFSIVVISETAKLVYRTFTKAVNGKLVFKNSKNINKKIRRA